MLSTLFDRALLRSPIGYWQQRDLRTLRALNPSVKADEREGLVKHTALGDAMYQALHCSKILREMNGWPHPREVGHDVFACDTALAGDEFVASAADTDGAVYVYSGEPKAHRIKDQGVVGWELMEQGQELEFVTNIGPISYAASLSSLRLRPEQPAVTEQQPTEA